MIEVPVGEAWYLTNNVGLESSLKDGVHDTVAVGRASSVTTYNTRVQDFRHSDSSEQTENKLFEISQKSCLSIEVVCF